ncbi:MAG TPA: ATP-binding cassette domain-containing protein [Deltaproteobacteria bacterium]|jgi:energy-coupling factor transport system ATP-binding protein|nr:ATP-binding cassette domain-containing protein [Deltaproteobacteria bacterium]HOI05973.1 ATP-binding cassette domain-containing protein [Deltaproteobacteria bacterium]
MKIACRDLSFRYDTQGDDWALKGVSFEVGQGEKVAVVGPAGSGKTTLIQLLDALILPTGGDVLYDGQSVKALAKARRLTSVRRRIGLLFQFPEHQFFHETAYEELTFSLRNFFDLDEADIERRSREIMGRFGMDAETLKGVSPFVLSSGEKRKLALASSLLSSPEVLILDEPTAGMDASGRRELLKIISGLSDTTVIVVTHNLEDFLPTIDRCLVLSASRLVADVQRTELAGRLADLEAAGITPPLVLLVRMWLLEGGIDVGQTFEMEGLIKELVKELGSDQVNRQE